MLDQLACNLVVALGSACTLSLAYCVCLGASVDHALTFGPRRPPTPPRKRSKSPCCGAGCVQPRHVRGFELDPVELEQLTAMPISKRSSREDFADWHDKKHGHKRATVHVKAVVCERLGVRRFRMKGGPRAVAV